MSRNMQTSRQRPIRSEPAWLNRNVVGMGVTSLLSDVGHEMITTLLPGFLAVLGVSAAALGAIEGVADSVSSFVKLGSGWVSDRFGHRKPMAVVGYVLTGLSNGLFALAHGSPVVLAARTLGWFGRGFRTPLRNAILAGSVPAEARGKAFGFERAGDTMGAIVGPLLAVGLLAYLHPRASEAAAPFRTVFWISLLPGLGAALAFATLVRERGPENALPVSLWGAMRVLPRCFRRFLWGAGTFGIGDFARTLMILAATQLLAPRLGVAHAAQTAGLLYVGHNVSYAAFSYPVGALSDRLGRRGLLAFGYLAGALAALGFLGAFLWRLAFVTYLLALFILAGLSIAVVDALEGAFTADLVSEPLLGTAYGVLGAVNGVGDLVASVAVGFLWTSGSPVLAFAYAALLMGLGAWVFWRIR